MALRATREEYGSRSVLVLEGDLDLLTAPQLTEAASALIDAGARNLIVDARGVEFCDSTGLSVFVRMQNRLREQSGTVVIAGPTPMVRGILEVTALTDVFLVTDTIADALAVLDQSS